MKILTTAAIFLTGAALYAQDLSFSRPGKRLYQELSNPARPDAVEWARVPEYINVSFVSDNIRFPKEKVPAVSKTSGWNVTAWKGEKVHTQILIWTKVNIPSATFTLNDLKNEKGDKISSNNLEAGFIRYVMSDGFFGGCSQENPATHDSSLVADPIDIIHKIPVTANSVQPVWLSIRVPADAESGIYRGTILINAGGRHELNISLVVSNHILPPPSEWKFDLDLWQYPAPIARIHDVPLWSEKHFKLMHPYYETLAKAGQKVISANIIEQPWGLDHVHFDDPSLVKWTRHGDGTWSYDFSLFDKYISFVMSCGITQRINCYSMVTWDLSFIFYDEALGRKNTIVLKPGTDEYTAFWSGMIKAFTAHLKEKGWFGITAIAFDERPVESMKAVIKLLRDIDPGWKIALAGDSFHPEIENDIYDYSLASYLKVEDSFLKNRKEQGRHTTFYTACPEHYPNGYTFSPPAENAWLGWYAAARGYTGYLWWAFNTWVKDPLHDTRWRRYPAGSLFQFYPGPRSSVRFEKYIEGIQANEKISVLRQEFTAGGQTDKLKELDNLLSGFNLGKLDTIPAAEMVEAANQVLNKF